MEVPSIFKQFLLDCKNQYELQPKTVCSDNGTKFTSKEFHTILKTHGIHHQLSCPYTPQQNGRVEHKHQYIIQMARSLKIEANIPDLYWGECALMIVFLINRTPTPILENDTLFLRFFKTNPKLDHLRIFGCRVFAKINSSVTKFDK